MEFPMTPLDLAIATNEELDFALSFKSNAAANAQSPQERAAFEVEVDKLRAEVDRRSFQSVLTTP